jgi:hypothetical protein
MYAGANMGTRPVKAAWVLALLELLNRQLGGIFNHWVFQDL